MKHEGSFTGAVRADAVRGLPLPPILLVGIVAAGGLQASAGLGQHFPRHPRLDGKDGNAGAKAKGVPAIKQISRCI